MHETIELNDTEPSIETVRRWGYDTRLVFIGADEDGILCDPRYVPVMLELAADPACPKRVYVLSILRDYTRFLLAWRHLAAADMIAADAEKAITSPDASLREWGEQFLRVRSYLAEPRPLTEDEAEALGFALLQDEIPPSERWTAVVAHWTECHLILNVVHACIFINRETGVWTHPRVDYRNE